MNKIFFPFAGFGNEDPAWQWLCSNMKDKFGVEHAAERHGNYLIFYEEEDMQLFILMWGEYL